MDGNERRELIMKRLEAAKKPISASKFAGEFGVSRQIVVGDVALLRAAGRDVVSTARGYVFKRPTVGKTTALVLQHTSDQTEDEMLTIVKHGGKIINVVVGHPLYGEITAQLGISTEAEVHEFSKEYHRTNASLLSALTGGIHVHTIGYETEADLARIKQALNEKGLLYHG